jgi:hypothetical protein
MGEGEQGGGEERERRERRVTYSARESPQLLYLRKKLACSFGGTYEENFLSSCTYFRYLKIRRVT